MKKLLFLFMTMFLIALLPNASAYINRTIYQNTTLNVECDNSTIHEGSPYANVATETGTVGRVRNNKIGNGTCVFTDTQQIEFAADDEYDTYTNLCVWAWVNWTSTAADEYDLISKHVGDTNGLWRMTLVDGASDSFRGQLQCADPAITVTYTNDALNSGNYNLLGFNLTLDGTSWIMQLVVNGTQVAEGTEASCPAYILTEPISIGGSDSRPTEKFTGKIDSVNIVNRSCTSAEWRAIYNAGVGNINNATDPEGVAEVPDTTPPAINQNSYNMTSEGGAGCVNWRANPATPCSTSDTTPTVNFTTTESAWCAIGTQSINFTQYVNLGIDRNCTIGQGTSSHTCTLVPDDELTFANSNIYLSCRDSNGNENTTGKSTSGALSLTITGLETGGDSAIGVGIQNALLSGYTNYTNQQVYARNLAGQQDFGTFDWVAKKGSKAWAFNYITNGEAHVGLFNLTPVLYVLEMSNITNTTITNKVEALINATK